MDFLVVLITPRRFKPQKRLPVLHIKHDGWGFTALFSNTAQAHELEKIHDQVVIYFKQDGKERLNTVVTETKGVSEGKRVVGGRDKKTTITIKYQRDKQKGG